MPTTTQSIPNVAPGYNPSTQSILCIADAADIKHALEEMFYAYVWNCTGRDEQEHETICAVYHGLLGLVNSEDPAEN